eukprot:scaffold224298_cov30-Tisochrysis_lutea.AAC.1
MAPIPPDVCIIRRRTPPDARVRRRTPAEYPSICVPVPISRANLVGKEKRRRLALGYQLPTILPHVRTH